MPKLGLAYYQEFVLIENVYIVVESLLGLEPPQLSTPAPNPAHHATTQ